MKNATCKHESCNCNGEEVRNDGYCSDSCSRGDETKGGCACGHPSCGK